MHARERWSALRDNRPVAVERATVVGAMLLVVVVSLWQFEPTLDGAFRGLSLGVWTGIGVWLILRRRRIAANREAAARDVLRLALARELHDTVAGDVAAIGIQAAGARRVAMDRPQEAAEALERIETLARSANLGLRRMLDALRAGEVAATEPSPGLARLPDLAESYALGPGAPVRLAVEPDVAGRVDTALGQAAYRIVEEAIRNARVHAGSVPIDVRVATRAQMLRIDIENDAGRPAAGWPGSGLGLVGMRERAAVFGGQVEAGTTATGGFRVSAMLPLDREPSQAIDAR